MREHGSVTGLRLGALGVMAAMAAMAARPNQYDESKEITLVDPLPTLDPLAVELLRERAFRQSYGTGRRYYSTSRYMPHIGAKERARHAGKPDGPMHVTGWQRRAEHAEWLASQA